MKKEVSGGCKNFLLVLSLMFLLVLSSQLVSAQATTDIFDPILNLFRWDFSQDLSPVVAQWLFLILLTLLIWSILSTTALLKTSDGQDRPLISWVISGIISFLGVAFLTPEEIWLTLTSYAAMAITILFLIPFGILALFTYNVVKKNKIGGVIAQRIIWTLFFVFLVARFILGVTNGQIKTDDVNFWVFLVAVILTGLAVLLNKKVVAWIQKTTTQLSTAAYGVMKRKQRIANQESAKDVNSASS